MGSYRKGLTLSLGSVLNLRVDVNSVIPSASKSGGQTKMICTEHQAGVKQQYLCEEGDHHLYPNETGRGVPMGDGKFRVLEKHDRPQVPKVEVLELTPVPTKELTDNTVEGESFYYLTPTTDADKALYGVVQKLADLPKMTFITRGPLRTSTIDKMWRVETFRGTLVLREMKFPSQINKAPDFEVDSVDKATYDLAKQFVGTLLTTWDKVDTHDRATELFQQWVDTGHDIEFTAPTEEKSASEKAVDLQNTLAAAVKAAQAAKNNE